MGKKSDKFERAKFSRKKITSATAVKLDSQSLVAKSASVLSLFARYFLNHFSPASAWLTSLPATGPIECLDVMSNLVGVRAAMKMIQPFDLSERVYGAVEFASSDSH